MPRVRMASGASSSKGGRVERKDLFDEMIAGSSECVCVQIVFIRGRKV